MAGHVEFAAGFDEALLLYAAQGSQGWAAFHDTSRGSFSRPGQ